MRGFANVVVSIVMILLGIYITYQVYTQMSNEMSNVTGLWGTGITLLGIIGAVIFIVGAVDLLRRAMSG